MAYFSSFPKIFYDVRGLQSRSPEDIVTNIMARVLLKASAFDNPDTSQQDLLQATGYFQKHIIQDGERLDTLAYEYYGDSELHWIIAYANGVSISNPYYDFPLTQFDLHKFITKKYGAGNENATHHFENADKHEVDSNAPGATIVSNFLYEERLNDTLRPINILQTEYVPAVVKEFKELLVPSFSRQIGL